MQVEKREVVRLCQAIGYKTAQDWNEAKLRDKLAGIARNFGPGGAYADDDSFKLELPDSLVDLINKIVKAKGKVEIVDEITDQEIMGSEDDREEEVEEVQTVQSNKQESGSGSAAKEVKSGVVSEITQESTEDEEESDEGSGHESVSGVSSFSSMRRSFGGLMGGKRKREITRIESVCKAFKMIKAGQTLEDVARIANEIYVKSGGNDSIKSSRLIVNQILPAAIEFGVVRPARIDLTPLK